MALRDKEHVGDGYTLANKNGGRFHALRDADAKAALCGQEIGAADRGWRVGTESTVARYRMCGRCDVLVGG